MLNYNGRKIMSKILKLANAPHQDKGLVLKFKSEIGDDYTEAREALVKLIYTIKNEYTRQKAKEMLIQINEALFIKFLHDEHICENFVKNLRNLKCQTLPFFLNNQKYYFDRHTFDYINQAFCWRQTEEGNDFWREIYRLWNQRLYSYYFN